MKYEFDFPYEIKTCQACPFMSIYKGCTHCAFAPYGEQRSIRYGTCPLRVAGWRTGIPTDEGWYIIKLAVSDDYFTNYWEAQGNWRITMNYNFYAWQKIEPYKEKEE